MPASLAGSRLRERRLALGLRQAEVAKAAGVSASYLNLIEHNRRRIAGDGLARLATALGLPLAVFEEGADSALIDDLRSAAATAASDGIEAEVDRAEEFAGRFPGWAATTATLARRAARSKSPSPRARATTELIPTITPTPSDVLATATGKIKLIAASGALPNWPMK